MEYVAYNTAVFIETFCSDLSTAWLYNILREYFLEDSVLLGYNVASMGNQIPLMHRHIPEEWNVQLHQCENLRTHTHTFPDIISK
jgi:hypothetical protein